MNKIQVNIHLRPPRVAKIAVRDIFLASTGCRYALTVKEVDSRTWLWLQNVNSVHVERIKITSSRPHVLIALWDTQVM